MLLVSSTAAEVSERAAPIDAEDVVAKLQSSNWKERVEGVAAVAVTVDAMSDEDAGAAAGDTIRALALFPGFDDKVFQVLAKVFEVLDPSRPRRPSSRNTTGPSRCRDSRRKSRT